MTSSPTSRLSSKTCAKAASSASSHSGSYSGGCRIIMARLTEAGVARLEDARQRAESLATELSDPTTFSDARRAAELSREHSELASIVDDYARYRTLVDQIGQAEHLLRDGADEDLKLLAREEIESLEAQLDVVVGGLQEFLRPRDPNDERD